MNIAVIIPAFNEENSIAHVVRDIPTHVQEIIVCNNGSTDNTVANAKAAGATVLTENKPGYGNACLKGMAYLEAKPKQQQPDVVVFIDGDYSDYPEELDKLVLPIKKQNIDLVIGTRALGERAKGSMTPQQVFGNWLATKLMKLFYGANFTDLGPFRAIKWQKLLDLNMQDKTYGWTIEMQIKALKQKYSYTEVPVTYRKRIGVSKVSGTVKGTILAGYKIIATIFKYL
ncbi:MAG: glycosyltransferase family 2 protein [Bacteroidetes bacterium]|nr:glycosyltransferase family 2 protein [Bacteroidota bacterium]